ncbi:VWA domain-containing protein [Candidatus Nanohalococcus occultus]|uniref:VWA domain-containing protein n=1 Tax=Candidatus Nanohalococcus occultus TaxID=2978047 RepID=UPI0039E0CB36
MAGFEQPLMLLIALLAAPALYVIYRRESRFQTLVGVSRISIIILLAIGAAQPFIQSEQQIMEEPTVTVLKDSSSSAKLLDDVELDFEDVKVETRTIASGNASDLRQGILRNIEPDSAYVTVSDFQSSEYLEDMARKINQENASLNALKPETRQDSAVSIEGPSTTVPGAENSYTVTVSSTGPSPEPEVVLNGETIDAEKTGESKWSFTRTFDSEGSNSLKASIDTDDSFSNNNEFFKTIRVTEKPEVLFIGDEGSFGREISRFYDVTYRSSLPDDLDKYYSIISTNDIESSELSSYVAEGNGFIYTGDTEKEMSLSPVTKAETDQSTDAARIMLTVDISVSTGEQGVKMSKKLAYNLVEDLPSNSKVGVVAYNGEAYLINEPVVLAENRDMLKSKISRLKTEGPSEHQLGVRGAKEALKGKGNIIFISDGRAEDTTLNGRVIENKADEKALEEASQLGDIRLISVGVGDRTNTEFLRELAQEGNGKYVDANNARSIAFEFTAGGAASGTNHLETVREHFITRGLDLSSSAANFDSVKAKPGADVLVAGRDGSIYLSSWRYGLGRVAAFSGGSSQQDLLLQEDPLLATRTVSWTVGDPQRKQERWIEAEDARKPEKITVRASYDSDELKRQSSDLYSMSIRPESRGFGSYENTVYAYNYPYEYQNVGYNPRMTDIVRDTGGGVYLPNETEQLKQDIKSFSSKTKVKRQQLGSYLIALALIVFLAEVGYRKAKGKK